MLTLGSWYELLITHNGTTYAYTLKNLTAGTTVSTGVIASPVALVDCNSLAFGIDSGTTTINAQYADIKICPPGAVLTEQKFNTKQPPVAYSSSGGSFEKGMVNRQAAPVEQGGSFIKWGDKKSLVVPAVDPVWDNVVLLLHFNESNGATVINDSSIRKRVSTANGNAKVTSVAPLFSPGCSTFDGLGDFWDFNSTNTDWCFRSADFTVETWVKSTQLNWTMHLVGNWIENFVWSWALRIVNDRFVWHVRGQGYSGTPEQWPVLTSTTPIVDGQWHHIAASRSAGVLRIFVDGKLEGSTPHTIDYNVNLSASVTIGRPRINAFYDFKGSLDEVRVTFGVGRYITDFVRPAAPFPDYGPNTAPPPSAPISQKDSLPSVIYSSSGGSFEDGDYLSKSNRPISTMSQDGAFAQEHPIYPVHYEYVESAVYPYLYLEGIIPAPTRVVSGINPTMDLHQIRPSTVVISGSLSVTLAYSYIVYIGFIPERDKITATLPTISGGSLSVTLAYSHIVYIGFIPERDKITAALPRILDNGSLTETVRYISYSYSHSDKDRLASGLAQITGGSLA